MGEHGHQAVGICVGVMVAAVLHHWGFPLIDEIAGGAAAFPGATAPDWLEIAHAKEGQDGRWHRSSIIPHRTITHWWPLWFFPLLAAAIMLGDSSHKWAAGLATAVLGFCAGGLSHLICDIPDPTGIPISSPRAHSRISLRWWKSGSPWEWIQVAAFAGCAWVMAAVFL